MPSPEAGYPSVLLLDAKDIANRVRRLAWQIRESHPDQLPCFVGIETRGVTLAERVRTELREAGGEIPLGRLDISLYRDDLDNLGTMPLLKETHLPFAVEGAPIILFDDVLFTGRTVKAALDVLADYGRPERIELAVLIDRGNRELPIRADYVGRQIETTRDDYVRVRFREVDGEEGIYLLRKPAP